MRGIEKTDLTGPWSILSRAPMVRLTIPMVLGIAIAQLIDLPLISAIGLFLLITAVSVASLWITIEHHERWKRGVLLALWMLSFGIFWTTIRDRSTVPQSIQHHLGKEGPWLVRTITLNRVTATQIRADAEVEAWMDPQGELKPAKGTIMLTLLRQNDEHSPRVGDRMLVESPMKKIMRIPDPGGFDRTVWAAARGIELELFATWHNWRRVDHTTNWIDHFSALRQRIATWINASELNDRERALVKALVLGQRDELDSEQKSAFARSGTIHVLAVSGMHVGLIYVILGSMLNWMGNRRMARIFRGVLILIALWMYAGITGGAPSILRATIMFSFITIADMTARRTEPLNSLFAAMFLLLLIDPQMLGMIGFQLSFLAVLGIVLFFKPLEELWTPRTWIMRKIWSLAVLSLAAQAFTTPVSLFYFKAFPVWFLPANLIVVTAVGLSVWLAIALIILHQIPVISTVITWALTLILKVVSITTGFFADLPFAYPSIRVDLVMVIMLYMIVIAVAGWWAWQWRTMRWVAATALLILLFNWAVKARSINGSATFTLYDERVGVMASMINGREQVVLVDPNKIKDDPYVERKILQHGKARGLKQVSFLSIEELKGQEMANVKGTFAGNGRWMNHELNILFVNDPEVVVATGGFRFDAVIIHDLDRIPEELLSRIEPLAERIVIAGKNHWRSREQAFAWCIERNIPVHDVFAQGAFILEVDR